MAKSLEQFRQWAVAQGGGIGNPGVNTYKGECVSLIQQYLNQVFGVPYAARGHAKDFVPPTFKKVALSSKPQAGDILRYGSRFGGGYGHIEMIDDTGSALGQNRNFNGRITRGAVLAGYSAIFRPTKAFNVKTPKGGGVMKTDLTKAQWEAFIKKVYQGFSGRAAKADEVRFHMDKSNPLSFVNGFKEFKWQALDKEVKALKASEKAAKADAKAQKDKAVGLANNVSALNLEAGKLTDENKDLKREVKNLEKQIDMMKKNAGAGSANEQEVVQNWLLRLWNSLFKKGE